MDDAILSLIAASIAFTGGHFAMSHPLRAPMVKMLGDGGFMGVYSLVSAAAMVWMYFAFLAVETPTFPLWRGFGDISWAVSSIVTLVAMILLAGSMVGNPALPLPGASTAAQDKPRGVFTITRHPMMWSFALWALAHIIAAPTARTLVVAAAILILALVGAHLQDRKKRILMGASWQEWESRTRYWPRWSGLFRAGALPWAAGTGLWLALTWLHQPLGEWAAGIWRWIG